MPIKRLHILANSAKNEHRCIAGRELLSRNGGKCFGEWIRPVSQHGQGEITEDDCKLAGGLPEVFDVVDVPLSSHAGTRRQRENWFIDPSLPWKRIEHPGELPPLLPDCPKNLWLAPKERNDRLCPRSLEWLGCTDSLYLIKVSRFHMEMSWHERESDGEWTRRRRAIFEYAGEEYNFSLTDPVMLDRYANSFPKRDERPRVIVPASGGNCLLCVSLTLPFLGNHYKIVATVIER
jgi:hypothetical protein